MPKRSKPIGLVVLKDIPPGRAVELFDNWRKDSHVEWIVACGNRSKGERAVLSHMCTACRSSYLAPSRPAEFMALTGEVVLVTDGHKPTGEEKKFLPDGKRLVTI